MDFKTYMRAKELAEYQAIVMYDKLQLDSPQWEKYHRRQRQAKEFTRRIMSMARKLEKRAEKAEAWAAAWKRKAKMLRDWYFYAEKHIFRSQELSQRVNELEATNAKLRAALVEASQWIPVNQHKPEESGVYLVYYLQDEAYGSLYFNASDKQFSGHGGEWESGRVTHWRRLPEPPEAQP